MATLSRSREGDCQLGFNQFSLVQAGSKVGQDFEAITTSHKYLVAVAAAPTKLHHIHVQDAAHPLSLKELAALLLQRAKRADVLSREKLSIIREQCSQNLAVGLQKAWRSRCKPQPSSFWVVADVIRGSRLEVEYGGAVVANLHDALDRLAPKDLRAPLAIALADVDLDCLTSPMLLAPALYRRQQTLSIKRYRAQDLLADEFAVDARMSHLVRIDPCAS
ncbi:MAG: hypothetical protein WBV96_08690 [Polyangia bacterium]